MKDAKPRKTGKIFPLLFLLCPAVFAFAGCGRGGEQNLELEEFREDLSEADTESLAGKDKTAGKEGGKNIGGEGGSEAKEPLDKEEKAVVYVCGAVNSPGVYTLAAGSRIYEALNAAGGIRSDGCGEILNQAKPIKDGERIYVPTEEEASESNFLEGAVNEPAKVNINTASREELMTLPGIGASKAESIISYRESKGGFESAEDIKNVEGIKEGVYGRLKDKITV